ncbi:MAG TPA: hypothetical protein VKY65_16400 [Alphaproteobacteria bacterium]|nr:hypothetical protein [Alphaproteobacteria bacterium]
MMKRFRPLPVAIFAAVLLLTVRCGDLLRHLDIEIGQVTRAQAAAGNQAGGAPAAAAPATPAPAGAPVTAAAPPGPAKSEAAKPASQAPAAPQEADAARVGEPPVDFTDSEISLLQSLSQRRAELDQRAREIDLREGVLKAAEKRVDEKIAKLGEMQATLQDLLKKFDVKTDEQLRSLVKIYENMKPRDAARIWDELEVPVIIQVVDRMNERKASAILAAMNPDVAKRVTDELIRRRQLPGDAAASGSG